jgi:hypothetical protein
VRWRSFVKVLHLWVKSVDGWMEQQCWMRGKKCEWRNLIKNLVIYKTAMHQIPKDCNQLLVSEKGFAVYETWHRVDF